MKTLFVIVCIVVLAVTGGFSIAAVLSAGKDLLSEISENEDKEK